jgi:hypothetical protein
MLVILVPLVTFAAIILGTAIVDRFMVEERLLNIEQPKSGLDLVVPYLDQAVVQGLDLSIVSAYCEAQGFPFQGVIECLDGLVLAVFAEEGAHPADVEEVVTVEFDPLTLEVLRARVLVATHDSLTD